METIKTWHTDVLVIGGGGAATAATVAAHEAGARTMLAVKGQFGVPGVRGAGATSNPVGDFWTIRTIGPKGGFFNPPEAILTDMLQTGLGMADPELCGIFVDEAPEAIARLKEMGMKFQSRMLATMPANENNKTNNIVAIQKAIIEQTQTQVLEQANLTDLIVEDNRCVGAVGVDDDGAPFIVRCGAVILATGGVGQLFRYSFNPPGNTGDGYAMALRAGASLLNMEFMQQGIATTWPHQGIVMLYEMEEPYRLLNSQGKSILEDYLAILLQRLAVLIHHNNLTLLIDNLALLIYHQSSLAHNLAILIYELATSCCRCSILKDCLAILTMYLGILPHTILGFYLSILSYQGIVAIFIYHHCSRRQ